MSWSEWLITKKRLPQTSTALHDATILLPVARSFVDAATLTAKSSTGPSNGTQMSQRHLAKAFFAKTSKKPFGGNHELGGTASSMLSCHDLNRHGTFKHPCSSYPSARSIPTKTCSTMPPKYWWGAGDGVPKYFTVSFIVLLLCSFFNKHPNLIGFKACQLCKEWTVISELCCWPKHRGMVLGCRSGLANGVREHGKVWLNCDKSYISWYFHV